LITLIILACLGPAAVLRAVAGLGCLIVIAAILLLLLWIFFGTRQESTTARVQPAPTFAQ
jgi:hypothetical protein